MSGWQWFRRSLLDNERRAARRGPLGDLAILVLDDLMTVTEAAELAKADPMFFPREYLPSVADDCWEFALTRRNIGCIGAELLHEWTMAHARTDVRAVHSTAHTFVRAAIEVLLARDDGGLYRRASRAADRMVATSASFASANYLAGRLHLAAYAFDPVNEHHDYLLTNRADYAFNRLRRSAVERSVRPTERIGDGLMPEPNEPLDRAVHHLEIAAHGLTGPRRGAALTDLAFAEYSRYLAGVIDDPTRVDSWCESANTLLPPSGEPLAGNRLIWLHLLRDQGRLVTHRPISAAAEITEDGLVHTALTAITAVRLMSIGTVPAGSLKSVVDLAFPWVAADSDLQPYRRYLEIMSAHDLPHDPRNCQLRKTRSKAPQIEHENLSPPALLADRVHGLLCGREADVDVAEQAAMEISVNDARDHHIPLATVITHLRLMTAVRSLDRRGNDRAELLMYAASSLMRNSSWDLAIATIDLTQMSLEDLIESGQPLNSQLLCIRLRIMLIMAYRLLPEASWIKAATCASTLLAHWAKTQGNDSPWYAMFAMTIIKGAGLSYCLTDAGPTARFDLIDTSVAVLKQGENAILPNRPDWYNDPFPPFLGFLSAAERDPGITPEHREANLRRLAQETDMARLAGGPGTHDLFDPEDILAALPADTALLSIVTGTAGPRAGSGLYVVTAYSGRLNLFTSWTDPQYSSRLIQTSLYPESSVIGSKLYSHYGIYLRDLLHAMLDDPLHRAVTREAARALKFFAEAVFPMDVIERISEYSDRPVTHLRFWPHESFYFLPIHLLPFRGGILADYFTVTLLPSGQCLALEPVEPGTPHSVLSVACADGGLRAGLPEELSLHDQAESIAGMFTTTALTGADATPDTVLNALGTTRYLHIAAHGIPDADAPLFSRLCLAGGSIYTYEILERDLRSTELVTLSACESTMLRFDLMDNVHGLAPAFLRAGARAVIGAMWPVQPDVALVFFCHLYTELARGRGRVAAFRAAQLHARARYPNYRDWGAFTYLGL